MVADLREMFNIPRQFKIQIKKINQKAILPKQGSDGAAGYDLYACLDQTVTINPHETVLIPTGITMSIPYNCWGGIYARSGKSIKEGVRPGNCVGVIDSDYRGEILVAAHNDSYHVRKVEPEERIAQFILHERLLCNWEEVEELDVTERNDGRLGSTGK